LIRLNTSLEQIAKTANPVVVLNTLNGESFEFRSITQAAKFLEVHPEILRRHIVKEKLYLDKYLITKVSAPPPSTSERAAGSLAKTLPGLRSALRRAK
jgi:hypothetical protein